MPRITTYVPQETYELIESKCSKECRSVSNYANYLISCGLMYLEVPKESEFYKEPTQTEAKWKCDLCGEEDVSIKNHHCKDLLDMCKPKQTEEKECKHELCEHHVLGSSMTKASCPECNPCEHEWCYDNDLNPIYYVCSKCLDEKPFKDQPSKKPVIKKSLTTEKQCKQKPKKVTKKKTNVKCSCFAADKGIHNKGCPKF